MAKKKKHFTSSNFCNWTARNDAITEHKKQDFGDEISKQHNAIMMLSWIKLTVWDQCGVSFVKNDQKVIYIIRIGPYKVGKIKLVRCCFSLGNSFQTFKVRRTLKNLSLFINIFRSFLVIITVLKVGWCIFLASKKKTEISFFCSPGIFCSPKFPALLH